MKYYYIYETANIINGKKYIGKHQTDNLDDGYIGSGIVLRRAIDKYGVENFTKNILVFCENKKELDQLERDLINEDIILSNEYYNVALGGQGGNLGKLVNDKIGKKMSICLKGKPKSDSHKLNLSISMAGRKQDPNIVKKRAKAWSDKVNKMGAERRKEVFGHEGSNNGFYGKSHTEETKDKIRKTIGNSRKGNNNPNAKQITVNGVVYLTQKECMKVLNLSKHQMKILKEQGYYEEFKLC